MARVVRMTAEDWELLRELRLSALADAPDYFWSTYNAEASKPEAWWRDFIAAGEWFVAYEDDNAVGLAAAMPFSQLDDGVHHLISMWVSPPARRRGIGALLVEAVKAWAREQGSRVLHLEVTEGNVAARRLYERHGFRDTGGRQPHPRLPLNEEEMRVQLD